MPLTFEANGGQTDAQRRLSWRAAPATRIFLTGDEAVLRLGQAQERVLRMMVVGANAEVSVEGQVNRRAGSGSTTSWARTPRSGAPTSRPTARCVTARSIPASISSTTVGKRELEYDFIVSPEASPDDITLRFEGAESMRIASNGDLVLRSAATSEVRQRAPVIYQERKGAREPVSGGYVAAQRRRGRIRGRKLRPHTAARGRSGSELRDLLRRSRVRSYVGDGRGRQWRTVRLRMDQLAGLPRPLTDTKRLTKGGGPTPGWRSCCPTAALSSTPRSSAVRGLGRCRVDCRGPVRAGARRGHDLFERFPGPQPRTKLRTPIRAWRERFSSRR